MEKELKDLEDRYFYLQMQDHWEQSDYRLADELEERIRKVKEQIKKEKNIDNNK